MGRYYIKVSSHTRAVPCDCSKEETEDIEEEEYDEDAFELREDFDKDACVFWK